MDNANVEGERFFHIDDDAIIDELKELKRKNSLVPFIGSGMSMGSPTDETKVKPSAFSNMPTWIGLVEYFTDAINSVVKNEPENDFYETIQADIKIQSGMNWENRKDHIFDDGIFRKDGHGNFSNDPIKVVSVVRELLEDIMHIKNEDTEDKDYGKNYSDILFEPLQVFFEDENNYFKSRDDNKTLLKSGYQTIIA